MEALCAAERARPHLAMLLDASRPHLAMLLDASRPLGNISAQADRGQRWSHKAATRTTGAHAVPAMKQPAGSNCACLPRLRVRGADASSAACCRAPQPHRAARWRKPDNAATSQRRASTVATVLVAFQCGGGAPARHAWTRAGEHVATVRRRRRRHDAITHRNAQQPPGHAYT